MSLEILPFFEPESCTWSYLVADTQAGRAAIIDPVWVYDAVSGLVSTEFTDQILSEAGNRNWQVDYVLETHAHADHLSSGGYIQSITDAKIGIGKGICAVQNSCKQVYNLTDLPDDGSQFDLLFIDGDRLSLGELEIRVMDTPGHTPDSICYLIGDAVFIGDTLFAPTLGSARCDFPGGDASQLFDSIQKIYSLPSDTRLFLCHDYPAAGNDPRAEVKMQDSLQNNIHVTASTLREDYVHLRVTRDAGLSLPNLILPSLQVNIRAGRAPENEKNNAAYLKIPFNQTIGDLLENTPPETEENADD